MKRQAAVSGMFYSSDRDILLDEISSFFKDLPKNNTDALGVMLPHAGHVYSGKTTAKVLADISLPDTVIILCPDHYGKGRGLSVYSKGSWQTPLGDVPIAEDLANVLLSSSSLFQDDISAHDKEHSAEVIVPFLQYLNKDIRILPVMVSTSDIDVLFEAGDIVAKLVQESQNKVLLVASSDMTHFESKERAFFQDKKAIDQILALNPEGLFAAVRDNNISMCGVLDVVLWLRALENLSPSDVRLIDYTTSGDVTGDFGDVVAYAGITVT